VNAGALDDLSALSPVITQIDSALAGLGLPIATADILDAVEGGVAFAGVNDVTTTGDYARGVNVSAPDGIAGVIAAGEVSTTGIDAGGIRAYGDEFAFVVANDVFATGAGSDGIIAHAVSGSALVIADTV